MQQDTWDLFDSSLQSPVLFWPSNPLPDSCTAFLTCTLSVSTSVSPDSERQSLIKAINALRALSIPNINTTVTSIFLGFGQIVVYSDQLVEVFRDYCADIVHAVFWNAVTKEVYKKIFGNSNKSRTLHALVLPVQQQSNF